MSLYSSGGQQNRRRRMRRGRRKGDGGAGKRERKGNQGGRWRKRESAPVQKVSKPLSIALLQADAHLESLAPTLFFHKESTNMCHSNWLHNCLRRACRERG